MDLLQHTAEWGPPLSPVWAPRALSRRDGTWWLPALSQELFLQRRSRSRKHGAIRFLWCLWDDALPQPFPTCLLSSSSTDLVAVALPGLCMETQSRNQPFHKNSRGRNSSIAPANPQQSTVTKAAPWEPFWEPAVLYHSLLKKMLIFTPSQDVQDNKPNTAEMNHLEYVIFKAFSPESWLFFQRKLMTSQTRFFSRECQNKHWQPYFLQTISFCGLGWFLFIFWTGKNTVKSFSPIF